MREKLSSKRDTNIFSGMKSEGELEVVVKVQARQDEDLAVR